MSSLILDIVLLVFIIGTTVSGLLRGALTEIFSILGVVIGIFIGARMYGDFATILNFLPQTLALVLAFVIIVIITVLVFYIIGRSLRRFLKLLHIGVIDNIFGLLFGFLKGSIIAAIVVLILSSFSISKRWTEDSKLSPFLLKELSILKGLLPEDIMLRWKTPREKQSCLYPPSSLEPAPLSQRANFPV